MASHRRLPGTPVLRPSWATPARGRGNQRQGTRVRQGRRGGCPAKAGDICVLLAVTHFLITHTFHKLVFVRHTAGALFVKHFN